MKTCSMCGENKPPESFYRRKEATDGRRKDCVECVKNRNKKWFQANLPAVYEYRRRPERLKADKALHRKRATGFTTSLFDFTYRKQRGLCGICACDLSQLKPRMIHADHCHTTLAPRGILCHKCNTGLGLFGDDPERLKAAIAYLTESPLGHFA